MNGWLAVQGRVLNFVLRRMATTPVSSVFNVLVIGIALSLPVGLYAVLQNVQGLVTQFSGSPQLSLFISLHTPEEDVVRIGEKLRQHSQVGKVEFVSRTQALEQLRRGTEMSDVMAGLIENPLPDAYIIIPKQTELAQLESLRDELKQWPTVQRVQLDSAWVRKLQAILHFGELAVLILATLLSLALTAITFNTIRLQILTRREEIEVAKLIGATHGFIRRPFIYFGVLQGVLGGLAAWGIVAISLVALNQGVTELAQLYGSGFQLHALSLRDGVSLLGFSAYLGWLGAWLSVTQHLRHIN